MEHAGEATPDDTAPSVTAGSGTWRTHLTLAAGLALCAAAFWFELRRALGGNELSWAYVFEWPLLGVFGVYMWWRVLHPSTRQRRVRVPVAPEFDRMRSAWEESQRRLEHERGDAAVSGED